MSATYKEFYLQLIDTRTGRPIDDDTGVYNVLTAADPSELTIYSDDKGTSQANPGTMTDGIIRFFTASSVTSCDVSVLTANSHAYFLEAVTPSQHRIPVYPEAIEQTLIVPYSCNTGCNVVVDTGFDIGAGMVVKDVYLHATTASTAGALDVGTSTDTDGFVDAAVVSVTGWKIYDFPETGGTADTYITATQLRGVLIAKYDAGTATDTGGGVDGFFQTKKYRQANATSGANLVYVLTATNSGGTGEGYIYLVFDRLPTAGN